MWWIGLQSSTDQGSRVVFILLCIGFLLQLQHPSTISTHPLFMFIIVSGFSNLFKVEPKGKIWRVHLKPKCPTKTSKWFCNLLGSIEMKTMWQKTNLENG